MFLRARQGLNGSPRFTGTACFPVLEGWFSLSHKHKHKHKHSHKQVKHPRHKNKHMVRSSCAYIMLMLCVCRSANASEISTSTGVFIVVEESWYRGILLILRLRMILCLCSGVLTCFLSSYAYCLPLCASENQPWLGCMFYRP